MSEQIGAQAATVLYVLVAVDIPHPASIAALDNGCHAGRVLVVPPRIGVRATGNQGVRRLHVSPGRSEVSRLTVSCERLMGAYGHSDRHLKTDACVFGAASTSGCRGLHMSVTSGVKIRPARRPGSELAASPGNGWGRPRPATRGETGRPRIAAAEDLGHPRALGCITTESP